MGIISRRYRNRRIGEFLKELDLTEGRSTGIPKIMRAIEINGSPPAIFDTDEDRSYFLVRFPVHPKSVRIAEKAVSGIEPASQIRAHDEAHDEAHDLNETEWQILRACSKGPQSTPNLLQILGYKSRTGNFKKALARLLDERGALEKTLPGAPKSKNQQYRLTELGRKFLEC